MFSIIINETKDFLRDRTNLFFYILFPVVLIFLLGSILNTMDHAEDAIGTINVKYQVDSEDQYLKLSFEEFIKSAKESNQYLSFTETSDSKEAIELAKRDEITAAVILTGNPTQIKIYEGTDSIKNKAVSAVIQSYVEMSKAYKAILTVNSTSLKTDVSTGDLVKTKDLGVHRTMIDYYAVSMLAMICFMSILAGAGAFLSERRSKTINRLIIAPKNRILLFLQKVIGILPQVILQIIIIMLTSVFVFKAHYANNAKDNLHLFLLFFMVAFCMTSIGASIGILIKSNPMATIMPILWTMMFFGGTYSKGMLIDGFSEYMPIYQVQQAAYDLAIFGHSSRANLVILICLVMTITALLLGAFLFYHKQEER